MIHLQVRVIALVVAYVLTTCSGEPVKLNGQGYEHIVVAIHKRVPEDPTLIPNIQSMFSEASPYLYNATGKSVYFKTVTIVVPAHWTYRPEYINVSGNNFLHSHIRIDKPNPTYGDSPYTLQSKGCGEEGDYIHFTPNYIKMMNDSDYRERYGPPGRQLVHEWAHFRYGVFDEYGFPGDSQYPVVYREKGELRPTACIKGIEGWVQTPDGDMCQMNPAGLVDPTCVFNPDVDVGSPKASIMFGTSFDSIDSFCDSSDKEDRIHNIRAPTKQNVLCDFKSTSEIIFRHKDFSNNIATDLSRDDVQPQFRIVTPNSQEVARIALVLDVSTSMSGSRLELLRQASFRLIEDIIPDGAKVGIVEYSTTATILAYLTEVNNVTRKQLLSKVPSRVVSATAIGQGLQAGVQVLEGDGRSAEGALIILVTDGEENVIPYIDAVLPDLKKKKVVVNSIALGTTASKKLETLSLETGGKSFLIQDTSGNTPISGLDAAFLDSVTSQMDVDLQGVTILQEDIKLQSPSANRTVNLDRQLGSDTMFVMTGVRINNIDMAVVTPDGVAFGKGTSGYTRDELVSKKIVIKIPDSEAVPGHYIITMYSLRGTDEDISLVAASSPKDPDDQPIRVRSGLNTTRPQKGEMVKVIAEVKKGYYAVLNAKVMATVTRPKGSPVELELRDNGVGADTTKDDGIYSAYFTKFNEAGRYAAVAKVINDGGAMIKKPKPGSSAFPLPPRSKRPNKEPSSAFSSQDFVLVEQFKPEETVVEDADDFERFQTVGTFSIDEKPTFVDGDKIPPNRITDLSVVDLKTTGDHGKTVTLQWTSPGDDLDIGNATSLELRGSSEEEDLLFNFSSAFLYTEHLLVSGTLTPLPSGQVQAVTITVPPGLLTPQRSNDSITYDVYFAIRASDASGNIADVSMTAAAHFGYPLPPPSTTPQPTTTTEMPTTTTEMPTTTPQPTTTTTTEMPTTTPTTEPLMETTTPGAAGRPVVFSLVPLVLAGIVLLL